MTIQVPEPRWVSSFPVHPVGMQQALNIIEDQILARGERSMEAPFCHVALNAAKVVAAMENEALANAIRAAGLVTADGVGVLALASRLGQPLPQRVTGIDLMEGLCARAAQRGWSVYFLGGEEGVAAGAAAALKVRYPKLRIAGAEHGFFQVDEVAAHRVAASGAQLLFIALDTPRKEHFAQQWGAQTGADFVMGVGGAFDVFCGRRRRAPVWVQGLGLEWAFRWAQEPRRLARRYGWDGLRFTAHLIASRRRSSGSRSTSGHPEREVSSASPVSERAV
ncbi:MAG TPA: glycosyltransferase [Deltaproteobacteria bacterium]|nr:glycosyltransferase [Deltaproteobacteria bacterium]HCP47322.1 glycosyltransferase [Deltaproteobacteria bacterium]